MKKDILSCILLIAVSAAYGQTRLTLIVKANNSTAITSVDFMNFAQTHKTSATYGDTIHLKLVDSDADLYNIRFIKKTAKLGHSFGLTPAILRSGEKWKKTNSLLIRL